MDNSRRQLLGIGAGIALGSLASSPARAEATPVVPPGDMTRLVTFTPRAGGAARIGVVNAQARVVDVGAAASKLGVNLVFDPADMVALIAAGPEGLAQVRRCAQADGQPLDSVHLHAPIPQPARNVYAVGWNYLEHFDESPSAKGKPLPKHPVFFTKATHTVNGPFDPIPYSPAVSTKIDWEGELAVIIGRQGTNIPESEAMRYVYGYAVINDTTARDMQYDHGGQWFKGKSLNGHGPMGPWLVPAEHIDPADLHLSTRVNGVVKQHIHTSKMYFKVPRIIAELSLGLTLEPGDIIATGTPSGTGVSRHPPEFLKPGDVMETEIDRIGTIRNVIGHA